MLILPARDSFTRAAEEKELVAIMRKALREWRNRRRALGEIRLATALLAMPDAQHYGYPLSEQTGIRTSVLYPILWDWSASEYLVTGFQDADRIPVDQLPRRYYMLTATGHAHMTSLLTEWLDTRAREAW